MKQIASYILIAAFLFSACTKEQEPPFDPNVKGEISVEFDNIAGSSDLQLNTGTYTNASNETFSVTKLKYYVSNFVFTKTDGTVYTVPQTECYFLIDESDEHTHAPVMEIPEGEYSSVSFMVGVDSLRSTMDISQRTGVLDPTGAGANMYWSWNSGYIFFKMEGTSPASPSPGQEFMYHIGLFGGISTPTINNLKTITLDLTSRGMPQVKLGKETNIHLMVDILKMFSGTTNVSIATNPIVMVDPFSANIANNYANMFRHDHTEN